jgi:hypothetical protein
MTKGGPEGKDFSDEQLRKLGIDPDEMRSKPKISEWASRLARLDPVELSSDPVNDIRAERDGAPGTRLDRLIKLTERP